MFGAGPYNCLGQNLARMEIEEALAAVAERYPDLLLTGEWERSEANAVSETKSLLVELGRPAPRAKVAAPRAEGESDADVHSVAASHLAPGESVIDCEIAGMRRAAKGVITLDLRARDGSTLPEWEPGSHIDLVLPGGLIRQYSLCGDRDDRGTYRIAVLREEQGTGGSAFVHDRLTMAEKVSIRGPRNNFALREAPSYLFVAGGIGITAMLPMVRDAERRGADWSLVYLGRDRDRMAFLDELSSLPAERVRVVASETEGRLSVADILAGAREGTQVYACGPGGLLTELVASWPEDDVHVERFEPDAAALSAPTEAFTVRLTGAGKTLDVPAEKSILDVVEDAGISWPYSCREGTCGTCETRIVAGSADHRDAVLTPAERRRNEYMMICVSRAASPDLSLEI
jgi:ferredoxin-NADP reductase